MRAGSSPEARWVMAKRDLLAQVLRPGLDRQTVGPLPGIAGRLQERRIGRLRGCVDLFDPRRVSGPNAAPGKRPTRTVVGITWGVDEVNAFTQPRQDALLKEMQLDTVLGGADA
jgi:hypothetical protein